MKVVIDAYDGTITYYADLSEPILAAWNAAFPGLFTDFDEAPASLAAHFRYPENLLQIQAEQYTNYHVTDPTAFYQQRDFWQVPERPDAGHDGRRGFAADRALLPAAEDPGPSDGELRARVAVRPRRSFEHGGVDGGVIGPGELRRCDGLPVPGGAQHRGAGPDLLADEPGPDVLRATIAPGLGRIGHPVRRSPRDPGRGFVPLRPAGLRPVIAAVGDPGTEARPGRQRQRGRRDRGRVAP